MAAKWLCSKMHVAQISLHGGNAGSIPNDTKIIFSLFLSPNLIPYSKWVVAIPKSSSLAFKRPSYKQLKFYLWEGLLWEKVVKEVRLG